MASPISSSPDTCTKVNVLVKNVYAPSQSHTFEVTLKLSILKLKYEIQAAFPSKPAVEDQKLIFGGKICSNDTLLETILKQLNFGEGANESTEQGEEPVVVFHLMCPNDLKASEAARSSAADEEAKIESKMDVAQVNQPGAPVSEANSSAQNVATDNAASPNPLDLSRLQAQFFQRAMLVQQQSMLLMQIQYLEQMVAYYQAFPATANGFGAENVPTVSRTAATTYSSQRTQTAAQIPRPPPGVVPPQFQHVFGHRNQFPYANPIQAQRNEPTFFRELTREVYGSLDLRLALKMGFMIFIIGQDTPYERVLILGLCAFALYLHITGILTKSYRVYQRHFSPRHSDHAANTNGTEPAVAPASNEPNRNVFTALHSYVRISQHRGFFTDVWSFLLGFVCSVVPAWNLNPNEAPEVVRPRAAPIPM
uniref:Uncharacterized protein AlNc14C76G5116 n=1 Tax=Albugo laibachii Nc14 TaxID=890382 RepID=F0WER6_9STRA|nr:conserved hypothetical protein [Albugo laibachii Nc14]|eukprot:CCA19698.1 conserved hypothetical protein [Albugo laibachii Nc14]